jgi:hypothetical protein
MIRFGRTAHACDQAVPRAEHAAALGAVMVRLFVLVVAAVALALPATAGAADIHATPSTFASAVSQAQNGDTILLASGSYGTWSGTNKAITIKNDAGATPTMRYSFGSGDSGFTLDGMSGMGGSIGAGAHDLTIKNSTFTTYATFDGLANSNILFDHNTHNDINSPSGSPNARLGFYWGSSTPSGVTIQNSLMRGGDSDGVHTGVAVNVINNEFADICDSGPNHTDNIQFEGATGGRIAGNYIHTRNCESQGITSYDSDTHGVVIEDNVVDIHRAWGIEFYSDDSSIIRHNTVRYYAPGCYSGSACGYIDINRKSSDPAGSGTQVYDNVANVTVENGSSTARNDHNTSGQNVQYVGPTTTWSGFALASGSPGKGAASDGLDVGIRTSGSPPPDTTPPDTTITSAPADPSTSTSASFGFNSSESGSTFECKLDNGSYAACTTPKSYSGLAAGQHTFSVRATDTAANTDASPATWTWTINPPSDTTPPDTTITSGPSNPTTSTSASFAFSSTETGSTYECKLDAGSYVACSSPKSYSGLAASQHTFSVRATDAAGNTDASPATQTWTINPPADTTPPDTTITSGPSGATNDSTPSFAFTASELGSMFQCRVDSGAYAACTSPWTTPALADGSHTVNVRATDAAGNTDASPATRSFTVDTVAPTTTITSSPPALSLSGSGSVTFTVNESGATSQCRLDGGAWSACTSPYQVSGLGIGGHTVDVRTTDAAGNVESPGASASWTVVLPVTNGPTVTLVAPTANSTVATTTRLSANASSPSGVSRVEFWLDKKRVATDSTAPYASKLSLSGVKAGTHTVTARVFDKSGQAASSAELVKVSRATAKSRARFAVSVAKRGTLVGSAVAGPDVTRLAGQAPKQRMVRVSLTRCDDTTGAKVTSAHLRADGKGHVDGTSSRAGLCVLRMTLMK